MSARIREVPGSIVAPAGFLASGVFCDIKRLGTGKGSDKGAKRDLALIVSEVPAAVAGMFTINRVRAAPVAVCIPRAARGVAQAIVVNSGNANACTGRRGMKDALEMAALTAGNLLMPPELVLVGSTGRIGLPLPMENVRTGIRDAAALLGNAAEHADEAAEAIMTSDTRPKRIAVALELGGRKVRIGGICKGAGMIQPGMSPTGGGRASAPRRTASSRHATMLCFLTTDAAIAVRPLRAALREAVAHSFNRITVDGDMSTNDTVLLLANGLAENPRVTTLGSRDFATFEAALRYVCVALARMIVRDGEGVHRVVTVRVFGARSAAQADAAARAVANSALVKTSWHGGDPNWGRIMAALGYSEALVDPDRIDIGYSAPDSRRVLWSVRRGRPTATSYNMMWQSVQADEFELHINLHQGRSHTVLYAADLTESYVDFNKGTVADPEDATALGG